MSSANSDHPEQPDSDKESENEPLAENKPEVIVKKVPPKSDSSSDSESDQEYQDYRSHPPRKADDSPPKMTSEQLYDDVPLENEPNEQETNTNGTLSTPTAKPNQYPEPPSPQHASEYQNQPLRPQKYYTMPHSPGTGRFSQTLPTEQYLVAPPKPDRTSYRDDSDCRDSKHINDVVKVDFKDVFAEPNNMHSFTPPWKASEIVFVQTKTWTYRISAAVFGLLFSAIWGFIYGLLSCIFIWILRPVIRLVIIFLLPVKEIFHSVLDGIVGPLFSAMGQVFSHVKLTVYK